MEDKSSIKKGGRRNIKQEAGKGWWAEGKEGVKPDGRRENGRKEEGEGVG